MIRRLNINDFYYLTAMEKRAGKHVYKQFGINRHELNALVGLAAYLMLHRKKVVSRELYRKWLGLNFHLGKKYHAYIGGLVDKGCCYRLAYRRADGNSLGVSPYGVRILQAYERAITEIVKQDKFNGDYQTVVFTTDDAVRGHKIIQHGRT